MGQFGTLQNGNMYQYRSLLDQKTKYPFKKNINSLFLLSKNRGVILGQHF